MSMQPYTFINSFVVVVYTNDGILYRLFSVFLHYAMYPGDSTISLRIELPYSFYGYIIFYFMGVSKFI